MLVVTGAMGFIGSALVWELNENGYDDIICVDYFGDADKWKNLAKRSVMETMTPESFLAFLADSEDAESIEAVFHLGACSSTRERDVDFLVENNCRYSQVLFQWCARNDIPFLHASSAATYGAGKQGYDDTIDSNSLIPLNPYGYSKVLFDRWALQQKEVPPRWYALRYFNVFGPQEYHKEDMASVVYKAFEQIRSTGKLKLFKSHNPDYEDGKQLRDFVYVKDVTSWMLHFLEQRPESGIYNMGFGKARSWLDLVNGVFASMDVQPQIEWINMPEDVRDQYQYFTEADMDKSKSAGLPAPEWDLEKGIADYVKNYLMKSDWYL